MTYTALASLVILGDDLSRVDRSHIAEGKVGIQVSSTVGIYANLVNFTFSKVPVTPDKVMKV